MNAISIRTIPNREAATQLKAFQDIYKYLKQCNFNPVLNVMDNESSKIVQELITDNKTRIKFVKAHSHEVNAAERTIQTVKNHLIMGLFTVHKFFPIQL